MESEGLHLNIDYVGSSGIILSPEQKAALQTSLIILQSENKFKKVYFWGKILGIKDDYFIAQGTGKDEIAERRTFYRYVVLVKYFVCTLKIHNILGSSFTAYINYISHKFTIEVEINLSNHLL